MNKIISPLKPHMQGPTVADLQERASLRLQLHVASPWKPNGQNAGPRQQGPREGQIMPRLNSHPAASHETGRGRELQGHIVDLTTAGGRAAKMAKYHDRVLTLEYVRPVF